MQCTISECDQRLARRRFAVLSLVWLIAVSVALVHAEEKPPARTLLTFSAMGDVPYTPQDYILLPRQVAGLPKESAFVVHVGDIKTGKMPCLPIIYETVADILAESQIPLFIIPGDNEWNDCANPDAGWKLWLKHFNRFDERWKYDFTVKRQPLRDENFAFIHSEVLLIGINLVGGRVHDPDEWKRRHRENLDWTRQHLEQQTEAVRSAIVFGHALPMKIHEDYFSGLTEAAIQFKKPILYLHGDGHKWIRDRPFKATNLERIQVDQGGIAPPITVTITDHPTEPFVIDRRK